MPNTCINTITIGGSEDIINMLTHNKNDIKQNIIL